MDQRDEQTYAIIGTAIKVGSRFHPQGVRGGYKGLKPQQHTLRGNDKLLNQRHPKSQEVNMKQTKAAVENKASENKTLETKNKINGQAKLSAQQKPGRAISDPKEVAQLVMMRIDHVNATKDELTTAVKALADTAKQLVSVYAKQHGQIEQLARKVEELEKAKK